MKLEGLFEFPKLGAAVLLLVLVAGTQATQAAQEDNLALGKKVFENVCAECHGLEGRGDGPKAKRLGFVARDFGRGSFKCRCTPTGALPRDEDLLRTVSEGLPGTPMVGHKKNLTEEEIEAVVAYIKTFSPRFQQDSVPNCLPMPEPVAVTPPLVAEGKQIYRLLSCWSCHGVDGRGKGPAAANLKDAWGQPSKVHNFVVMKAFKCGNSDLDIYRTMHTGLNGTPMPSYADAFLYGGDSVKNFAPFEDRFGSEGAQALIDYLKDQPKSAQLESLSEGQKKEVIERRSWALVHYLRSLLE